MANANEERTTYGAFERFLYFFVIPMLYSSVLVVILFIIFNEDVRASFVRTANNIPIVKEIVPDPKTEEDGLGMQSPELVQAQREARQQLDEMEDQLKSAIESGRQKDSEIEALNEQIAQLEAQFQEIGINAEEYEQQIQTLANMYANMNASRAAPILENLLPSERVLILSRMPVNDQVSVLEKMNPQIAAEATMALKDLESVEDSQIAALQERVAELETQLANRADALTTAQLSETFAAMDAGSAATVLLEMTGINEDEVVAILRAMNNQSRSNIISRISETNSTAAATLSSKLGN